MIYTNGTFAWSRKGENVTLASGGKTADFISHYLVEAG